MNSWVVWQSVVNGILAGGVYSLVGVGITIIFGVMKMVNFAAGSYLVWGMYFTYFIQVLLGGTVSPYLLIPLVMLAMVIFGYISFKLSIRRVLNKGDTSYILITVGLMFFLQNLAETFLGTKPLTVFVPGGLKTGALTIAGINLSIPRLIAFGGMLVFVLAVHLLLNKTLLGRAMRATSEKPEVAQMLGVNTERTYTVAFCIGVTLAAVAGLLITPLYYVSVSASAAFRIAPLMAIVLGGMGSIKGSFFGGLLVGVVEQLVSTLIDTQLSVAAISVLFLVVIYLRPQGLLGKRERTA
ncbi:branched-chain amino acid ABC transporter permease [Breznakiellaceae bacterium SP9]